MNNYPKMLYRTPGPHDIHGGKFDYRIVKDEKERDEALRDGWYLTTDSAKSAKEDPPPPDNTPPTRAELEQKAAELGIKFDGRTSDKKLADQIAAALEP